MSTFLTTGALKQDIVRITASSSPLALTSLSQTIYHIFGSEAQTVFLPDATTLEDGVHFIFINDSSNILSIRSYSGSLISTIENSLFANIYLSNNTTQSGVWGLATGDRFFADKNLRLTGGGIFSWELPTASLTFSQDIHVTLPPLSNTINVIPAQSIVIAANMVAYTILHRDNNPLPLQVYTANVDELPNNSRVFILAQRDNSDIIVGASFRLMDGQSGYYGQGLSQETAKLLGVDVLAATDSADWLSRGSPSRTLTSDDGIIDAVASIDREIDRFFGQLQLTKNTLDNASVNLSGTDQPTLRGEVLSQELNSRLLTFPSASINFTSGRITKAVDARLLTTTADTYDSLDNLTQFAQVFIHTHNYSIDKIIYTLTSTLDSEVGYLVVNIHEVDIDNKPTSTIVATSSVLEVTGSFTNKKCAFTFPAEVFSPQLYAAVLSWHVVPLAGSIQLVGSSTQDYDIAWKSEDEGTSWNISGIVKSIDIAIQYLGDALGIDFTPYALPIGEYFWYSVALKYLDADSLGRAQAQIELTAALYSNAVESFADFPLFPKTSGSRPLGFIQLYNNQGSIVVSKVRQLGIGGGGGSGSGGLISVQAADFTTSTLPIDIEELTVDGRIVNDGDLVLFGHIDLNKIYYLSGVGSSITFTSMPLFLDGASTPTSGEIVSVVDGNDNNILWQWNGTSWNFISLSEKNREWLGLTSHLKSGGSWSHQIDSLGQSNNVVVEGETLEQAIKRLDVRPDVLKRVRVIDVATEVLPITDVVVIDDITLIDGDKVLFGNPSLLGIYQVDGLGVVGQEPTWLKLHAFGGRLAPSQKDAVLVTDGSPLNSTIWLYNPALPVPWQRIAAPAQAVWTGTAPHIQPEFDGTLSESDVNLSLALNTIDKYFRGLQLKKHPLLPHRIKIMASATIKTDTSVLNFSIADRLMDFNGAELDFETGGIYASNGVDLISSFTPRIISNGDYFWYAVGLDALSTQSNNTISPQIKIDYASNSAATPISAPKPTFSARYTIGTVVVKSTGALSIEPITSNSIVHLGQFTGYLGLESTVIQNTIDIAALQAFATSMPMQQKFTTYLNQSIFDLTLFTIDPSNTVFDVDYLIDGRWQSQCSVGDFSDGAVRKLSDSQIELAEPLPEGKTFIVFKRTMSGGSPLVDLTAITVNLGFVTPRSVGTAQRPAFSFILKDKVTSDIWELEVREGVFQLVRVEDGIIVDPPILPPPPGTSIFIVDAGNEYIINADSELIVPAG